MLMAVNTEGIKMALTSEEAAKEAIDKLVDVNNGLELTKDEYATWIMNKKEVEVVIKALYEYICKTENSLSDERNEGEGTTTISYGEPVSNGRLDALRSVSKYLRRDIDNFAQKMNDYLDVLEEIKW